MNQIENLKQQILDLIECIYSHRFIKRLELTIDEDLRDKHAPSGIDSNGNIILDDSQDGRTDKAYVVKIYLHDQRWIPLVIAGEFETDDEFLLFVCEELRSRNLIRSERYKIQLHGNN